MISSLPFIGDSRTFQGAVATLLALGLIFGIHATNAQELATIPDAHSLAEAKKLVNEVYVDLLEAKTDDDRVAAARVLIMRAAETHDAPAAKYVMYDTARLLAIEAGDTRAAMDAIDGLAAAFNTSDGLLDMASASLQALSRKARNDKQHAALTQAGIQVAERMIAAQWLDDAASLLAQLKRSPMRSKRPELISAYKAMSEELRIIRAEEQRIADDLKAIKQNPDDPILNLSVGKFLTLYRDDWNAGLPLLARSSEETFVAAAKMDLAGASDTKTQIAIGDRWWAIAEDKTKIEQRSLAKRARYWYRLALPSSSGIERAVLTKRLLPSGLVKWGDLILEPGIRTMIEVDGDAAGAKAGPIAKKARWEFDKKPPGTKKNVTLRFEGYLYFPRTAEVGIRTGCSHTLMEVEINGRLVSRGWGDSESPSQLIKGYNMVRGSIAVSASRIDDPDSLPSAVLSLADRDGMPIPIPAEQWFHDVTR